MVMFHFAKYVTALRDSKITPNGFHVVNVLVIFVLLYDPLLDVATDEIA
jgi:hypothetical protein